LHIGFRKKWACVVSFYRELLSWAFIVGFYRGRRSRPSIADVNRVDVIALHAGLAAGALQVNEVIALSS
jgi:hypothetical protein